MNESTKATILRAVTVMTAALVGCGGSDRMEGEGVESLPRPVTVMRLAVVDPSDHLSVTGSLAAWKTEELGFQVGGRVEKVHFEPGENIAGRTFDEQGRPLAPGDVIAELERERYELALSAAQAREKTALAQAQALRTELEKAVPVRIRAAEASELRYRNEFARINGLYEQGTVTKAQFDKAKAEFDVAAADLEDRKASKAVKEADLEALVAQAAEAAESVEQARKDLEDTRLLCPFDGQIAETMLIEGGVVQAGQPVARVQLMDPLKVEISVSAETDRTVNLGDLVRVRYRDGRPPTEGYVWLKDTVADAATRTFRLTLLLRNRLVEFGVPDDPDVAALPRISVLTKPFSETPERKPPWFVAVDSGRRALYGEPGAEFVWRVKGGATSTAEGRRTLERVRVTPGERRMPFLQVATFRELTDLGDIDPEADLIAGAFLDADGEPITEFDDATTSIDVLYVRRRWMLRPGDYVHVDLTGAAMPKGLYVPMDAIVDGPNGRHVVVVEDSSGGAVARHVPVSVTDDAFLGTLRHVASVAEGALAEGSRIVVDGAYYVVDGESVAVAREASVAP